VSAVQLFAVTASHGHRGTFGRASDVVVFRDLAAIVKDVPYAAPGAGALRHYREVVESVFREQAVLPAPPGVVFRDRDVLTQWMELHYFTLLDALAYVEDRAVARVVVTPAEPSDAPDADPADGPGGGSAVAKREASEAVLRDALSALRRHAVATLPVGGDGGHAAATSFLVERARWAQFTELVAQENGRLGDHALRLSGPWPPYDFVRMQFTN
jgi:hypothetical protein